MVALSPNAAARATGSKFARCLRMISSVLSTSASPMLITGRVIVDFAHVADRNLRDRSRKSR